MYKTHSPKNQTFIKGKSGYGGFRRHIGVRCQGREFFGVLSVEVLGLHRSLGPTHRGTRSPKSPEICYEFILTPVRSILSFICSFTIVGSYETKINHLRATLCQ
jgi:hypothetical protein